MIKLLIALLMLLAYTSALGGTLYKCIDKSGTPTFSSVPCGADAQPIKYGNGGGSGSVQVKEDQFTDTINFATPYPTELNGKLQAQFVSATSKEGHFVSASILLSGVYKEWKYLRCHTLFWLLDGEPIILKPEVHDGKVITGAVIEVISVGLQEEQLARFASAKRIQYRICNDQSELTGSEISNLRSLTQSMQSRSK